MKSLSVSDFKAHLSAYLRDVQRGETYVITEHRRPVAEVRRNGADARIVEYPSEPFSFRGIDAVNPADVESGLAATLISEDRGE